MNPKIDKIKKKMNCELTVIIINFFFLTYLRYRLNTDVSEPLQVPSSWYSAHLTAATTALWTTLMFNL